MNEKKLNHDLIHLFAQQGVFAYKLPDPNQAIVLHAAKRPFDGFARFCPPINDFWFESKLIKNKLCAFDLSRIEEHQLNSLLQISRNGGFAAIILGFWIPRKEYWFMVFSIEFINTLIFYKKKSITKKELLSYFSKGYAISLMKKDLALFEPKQLSDKLICVLPEVINGKIY